MRRGTTPKITYSVDVDTATLNLERTFITIRSGEDELEFSGRRITAGDGTLSVTLTQAETLRLQGGAEALMQIRSVLRDGQTSIASGIMRVNCDDILKDGEI